MISLVVYIPQSHLEEVKEAMFTAGAGKLGNYDKCCWQTEGTGQFRPLEGSDPYLGKIGEVEKVKEWKVEMVCDKSHLKQVIAAMRKAHPYEEPAFLITDQLQS